MSHLLFSISQDRTSTKRSYYWGIFFNDLLITTQKCKSLSIVCELWCMHTFVQKKEKKCKNKIRRILIVTFEKALSYHLIIVEKKYSNNTAEHNNETKLSTWWSIARVSHRLIEKNNKEAKRIILVNIFFQSLNTLNPSFGWFNMFNAS